MRSAPALPLTGEDMVSRLRVPDLMIGPHGKTIPVFPEDVAEIERLKSLGFDLILKS